MFLKYRIMNYLHFDTYENVENVAKALKIPQDEKHIKRFGQAVTMLGALGFIAYNENLDIALYRYSSFCEYLTYTRKTFFDIAVPVSTIIMAITSIIGLF